MVPKIFRRKLFNGEVRSHSKGVTTLETPIGDVLKINSDHDFSAADRVWMAARPEKLQISLDKPKSGNCLAGEVWDIAYLGDLTIYKVKLSSGEFAKVSVLNTTLSADRAITWEDQVYLTFAPEAALVLAS